METATITGDKIIQANKDYTLFSWSKQGGLNPLNLEKAKGVYLWDRDGKKYIDFSSQLMNVNIGHGDQRITEAVKKTDGRIIICLSRSNHQSKRRIGKENRRSDSWQS